MTNMKNKKSNNKKVSQQRLAPLPTILKSRKRARQVTTLFHRYTKMKETASTPDEESHIDSLIEGIGGQVAYQKASQLSTSYYSTSKWVLGCLAQNGWLYGIDVTDDRNDNIIGSNPNRRRKAIRRDTRLLEIGAINTELLDAAAATNDNNNRRPNNTTNSEPHNEQQQFIEQRKYRLNVRAIDLHSMHDGIEEADFLTLPLPDNSNNNNNGQSIHNNNYDVIVCSMVLNCVTTPAKRGEMLLRIVHFLSIGGLVYLTIPKTCLQLSPYIDNVHFTRLLHCIGLNVLEHTKDSPKIAFFIGQKRECTNLSTSTYMEWKTLKRINEGRKYRNEFAITLPEKILK